jgi:uncharacterized protein YbaR (Trm112 family)
MSTIDPQLLDILVCPVSKNKLVAHGDRLISTDKTTRRAYGYQDGIPDLLIDHSQVLSEQEWHAIMQEHGIS